jgi:hypothetical protein
MFYRSDARSFYWRYAYGIGYDKLRRWWYGLCYKRVLEYRELGVCDEIDITEWINYRNNYWKDVNFISMENVEWDSLSDNYILKKHLKKEDVEWNPAILLYK